MTNRKSELPEFQFAKMEAAGNDFVFIDRRTNASLQKAWERLSLSDQTTWIRELCDRHKGIGGDGLVFLYRESENELSWDFFNSDGSVAEMCVNAARAVGLYARTMYGPQDPYILKTVAGPLLLESPTNSRIRIRGLNVELGATLSFNAMDGMRLEVQEVVAGVPHLVIILPQLDDLRTFEEWVPRIRGLSRLGQGRSNVTFVRPGQSGLQALTFERGVEGFTQACGSGAMAAAAAVASHRDGFTETLVAMPGGELSVAWTPDGNCELVGPARWVYSGWWRSANCKDL